MYVFAGGIPRQPTPTPTPTRTQMQMQTQARATPCHLTPAPFSPQVKLKFYRTSVQQNYNVDQVFQYLAELFIKNLREKESAAGEPLPHPHPSGRAPYRSRPGAPLAHPHPTILMSHH